MQAPPKYTFLPGLDSLVAPQEVPRAPQVFVAVDCGAVERLELLRDAFEAAGTSINLDHHVSSTRFGDVNLVDEEAASSCEIAYELTRRLGGGVDIAEATCFYTGIVTDTGRFQHASTSPATLRTAAELRELGVDHERVAREIYDPPSLGYLHLLGLVLSRSQLDDGVVWSWLDQDDLGEVDLGETEHLIDGLRGVRGSKFTALFKQMPEGGYKASLRSRGEVDVARIARAFGGGGHIRAAGFRFDGDLQEAIQAIQALAHGQDESSPPEGGGRDRTGPAGDR